MMDANPLTKIAMAQSDCPACVWLYAAVVLRGA